LGYSAEAASYLFEEFNKQGVLTSEFFLDDKRLLGGIPGTPDPELGVAFHAAIDHAEKVGQARLNRDQRDVSGLLAMTMSNGMMADYSSLIEKKQLATLHLLTSACGTNAKYPNVCFCAAVGVITDITQTSADDWL
jgi:hypothetical protein